MGKRKKVVQSIYDSPIYVNDGETLKAVHIVRGGPEYGRVLFTHSPCIEVLGMGCTVAHCLVDMTLGGSVGLRVE